MMGLLRMKWIPSRIDASVAPAARAEGNVNSIARHIAEIRGLLNQAIRRLERLEGEEGPRFRLVRYGALGE